MMILGLEAEEGAAGAAGAVADSSLTYERRVDTSQCAMSGHWGSGSEHIAGAGRTSLFRVRERVDLDVGMTSSSESDSDPDSSCYRGREALRISTEHLPKMEMI